ncbi:hypothetical protein HDU97_006982 [Phlyctochytrium planicorne]|nr:hypothetical protein HDU97_006982 [Phlyctochytrium planicorne]
MSSTDVAAFPLDSWMHANLLPSFNQISPYGPTFPEDRARAIPSLSIQIQEPFPRRDYGHQTATGAGIGTGGLNISVGGLRQRGAKLAHRTTKKTEKLVLLPGDNNLPNSTTAATAIVADISSSGAAAQPAPNLVFIDPIPAVKELPFPPEIVSGVHQDPSNLPHPHHHPHAHSQHPWFFDFPSSQPLPTSTGASPRASTQRPPTTRRTTAELTSKDKRIDLPRVMCYCGADAYRLEEVNALVRGLTGNVGGVSSSVYDECLYVSHDGDSAVWGVLGPKLAVGLPGHAAGVGSSGREFQQGFHAQYGDGRDGYGREHQPPVPSQHHQQSPTFPYSPRSPGLEAVYGETMFPFPPLNSNLNSNQSSTANMDPIKDERQKIRRGKQRGVSFNDVVDVRAVESDVSESEIELGSDVEGWPVGYQPRWMHRKELYLFDFGVAVFWNFTEEEELRYLLRLKVCADNPFSPSDYEIEDFHFQYDLKNPFKPRVYNDMITLKSGNPMIKLTISHAMAQSAKLALFENVMEQEITTYSALPKMMAKQGEFKLANGRRDVFKIVGRLFKLRMNVNLISNVLDTPELFWSEPELEGLYNAIRGYLEISQRVTVLNTRVEVISDLLVMLQDHLNHSEVTMNTIIVITLIVITCVVATAEVYVKLLRIRAGMDE